MPVGLGVDSVLPHHNPITTLAKIGHIDLTNIIKIDRIGENCHGWSPAIPRKVSHHLKNDNPASQGRPPIIPWTVNYHTKNGHPPSQG